MRNVGDASYLDPRTANFANAKNHCQKGIGGDQTRQDQRPVEATGQLVGFKHEAMTEEKEETQNLIFILVICLSHYHEQV